MNKNISVISKLLPVLSKPFKLTKKSLFLLLCCVVPLGLLLSACSNGPTPPASTLPEETAFERTTQASENPTQDEAESTRPTAAPDTTRATEAATAAMQTTQPHNENTEAQNESNSAAIQEEQSTAVQEESSTEAQSEDDSTQKNGDDGDMQRIEIIVGDSRFAASLYDNEAAKSFAALLPLTLSMSELNGNEKYYYLVQQLPTNASRQQQIKAGDLMLFGSNCLVLFYESFSSSYSYTPLGHLDNPAGLAEALGGLAVQVSFSLAE